VSGETSLRLLRYSDLRKVIAAENVKVVRERRKGDTALGERAVRAIVAIQGYLAKRRESSEKSKFTPEKYWYKGLKRKSRISIPVPKKGGKGVSRNYFIPGILQFFWKCGSMLVLRYRKAMVNKTLEEQSKRGCGKT